MGHRETRLKLESLTKSILGLREVEVVIEVRSQGVMTFGEERGARATSLPPPARGGPILEARVRPTTEGD
jgi:hypothetical protein